MWFCFSIYTRISVLVHSFLVLKGKHMLLCVVILLVMLWRCLCLFLYLPCVCCQIFFSLSGETVLYSWQPYSIFDLHIAFYILFIVFWSPAHFLPAITLIVFSALFTFTLILSIHSSQFSLLFRVILRNWLLSL